MEFHGFRMVNGDAMVFVVGPAGASTLPDGRDALDFGPMPYDWGNGKAGACQLGFAMLLLVCQDRDVARDLLQRFKWAVVAQLPRVYWTVSSQQIEQWMIGEIGLSTLKPDAQLPEGGVLDA